MKKGIVMEIDNEFLTLLTPEGQFLQAKKLKNCVLGEEILFTPIKKQIFIHRYIGIKQLSAAAVIILILLGSFIPMYQNNKAYAYMSIDVNPSLEIGINKEMQVVSLTPYNNAGKKIIAHLASWKKENITSATQSILKEMKKLGYLKKKNSVVISTVRIEQPEVKIEEQLTKNVDEIKEMVKESDLEPIIISGTEQDMEKAHHLGITTGKYKEEMTHPDYQKESLQQTNITPETEEDVKNVRTDNNRNTSNQTDMAKNMKQTEKINNNSKSESIRIVGNESRVPSREQKNSEQIIKQQDNKSRSETKAPQKEEDKKVTNNQMKKHGNFKENNHNE